jgi:hypothetical protein
MSPNTATLRRPLIRDESSRMLPTRSAAEYALGAALIFLSFGDRSGG